MVEDSEEVVRKRLARLQMTTNRSEDPLNVEVDSKRQLLEFDDRTYKQKMAKKNGDVADNGVSETVVDPVTSIHHEQC